MTDRLNPDNFLSVNTSITSQNGRYTLVMQGDGNLVLYKFGVPRWATGSDGQEVSHAIMQGDGNFVIYSSQGAIWASNTDGNPGAWLIVQDDGNVVIYSADGVPLWDTGTWVIQNKVPNFLPSKSAFKFSNSFSHVPLKTIDVLGTQIAIGDAANGLCGGMAFAARDYFEAGIAIPTTYVAPSSGALYEHLVNRLIDSFNLPLGPGRYMYLMNPALPDHETWLSSTGLAPHGRAWVMINEEWPRIRAELDSGHLSPLGLVTIKSLDPFLLGKNHQVLAYGYELDGQELSIYVYDPNHPNRDDIIISLNISRPQNTTSVNYSGRLGGDHVIWCFFHVNYSFSAPPTNIAALSSVGS